MFCAIFAGLAVLPAFVHASAAQAKPQAQRSFPSVAKRCSRQMHPGHGLQRFIDSLRPGDKGCLPPGAYRARKLTFSRSGLPQAPITLRSTDPAHPATIDGVVWVRDEANYVVLEDLVIVGNSGVLPATIIDGDNTVWNRIDVSNPASRGEQGGICFSLGQTDTWGYAGNTIIENSRIHDCGSTTNMNHGIYVQATTGRTIIRNNWIFRNGDRGIQLYPAAQNVLISHNVVYDNGSGILFSGDENYTSHDVTVSDNVISDSTTRWNVESWYPNGGAIGRDNVVAHNCVWATADDPFYRTNGGIAPPSGFAAAGNVVQRPQFEAAASGDLRLKTRSGCRGYGTTSPSPPGPRSERARNADAVRTNAQR